MESFLRAPARPRKGMPSKPIVGTAISIQVRVAGAAAAGVALLRGRGKEGCERGRGCRGRHCAPLLASLFSSADALRIVPRPPAHHADSWTWMMQRLTSSLAKAACEASQHIRALPPEARGAACSSPRRAAHSGQHP